MITTYTDAQIRLAIDYSHNYATARPDTPEIVKEHILGLCERLEYLLSERQAAMQGQGGEVRVIVDWRKGNDPRFVEVEGMDCKSVSIPWDQTYPGNGLWSMTLHKPAALQPPQPVRSVSEEDVEAACHTYYGRGLYCKWKTFDELSRNLQRESMRAALEHFAAIAQEKQS